MQPEQARREFEAFLAVRGLSVAALSVPAGFDAMLEFYRDVRGDGCEVALDGDMLLYQWGTYDWSRGEHFELDITRQLMFATLEDDEMWQLSLTFLFVPSPGLTAISPGNRWCYSPEKCDELRDFISTSSAYVASRSMPVLRVALDYGQV